MEVQSTIDRLDAQVPELTGRVQGALELTELHRQNALPQITPAAFVLPLGLRGKAADVATGLFRQGYEQVTGVTLFVESAGDVTGKSALTTLDTLIKATIEAIAGWAPDDALGQFKLSRADMVSMKEGMAIYQIDFALDQQLRLQTSQ